MIERAEIRPTIKEILEYQSWLFDTDGTTANTGEQAILLIKEIISLVNPNFDLNFSHKEIKDWDFVKLKFMEAGLGENDSELLENAIWQYTDVLAKAEPIKGASELVSFLYFQGKHVFSATSRPDVGNIKSITEDWIYDNMKYIQDVFVNPSGSNIKGPAFKAEKAMELAEKYGSVVIVEDYPGHVEEILKVIRGSNKDLKIHIVLLPYAKLAAPDYLHNDPMVTIMERDEDLGIGIVKQTLLAA